MSLRATPIENIPIFPGNSRPSSTEIDFVGDIRPQFGLKTVFPQAFGPTTEIDAYKMPRGVLGEQIHNVFEVCSRQSPGLS